MAKKLQANYIILLLIAASMMVGESLPLSNIMLPELAEVLIEGGSGAVDVGGIVSGFTGVCKKICGEIGQSCGLVTPCCSGLSCKGYPGVCKKSSCKESGQSCGILTACCSGLSCNTDSGYPGVCKKSSCKEIGQSCGVVTPCCSGLSCNTNSGYPGVCEKSSCKESGQPCGILTACCSDLSCITD